MTGRLLLLAACFLAASCARDWDARDGAGRRPFASQANVAPGAIRPVLSTARTPRAFASLPDRGDLAAYPGRVVRRDGAYTWHRADVSEEHALRAIVDGRLTLTAPSGEILQFAYERHVEHASGDWTWIGRLERGTASDEAILTFGERAAFGSIAQPGKEPLKLTIRDGVSWLVETDRMALGRIVNAATRPRGPDFLLPPDMGPKAESDGTIGMASAPVAANSTPPSGTTVVDVVLGYTSGFAAGLGSQSAAVTRLNFLVDVVNESYVNSQVAAQVRLVHTVQVGYPDATANKTALEELTGYRSGTGFITPNPAFDALRAARDQYGADLVSLVRKFNDPENEGCGIAWLIGGGQSGIDAGDAPFGYSVTSDGTDVGGDGKTYFCRDETLAHELGHNMGSQHDRDTAKGDDGTLDAKDYGAYPYSFGYKTTAGAGNFYTIMAYGDTGQTRYRVFSNPDTTFCGGFACGVPNQANNAMSLGLIVPVVSTFRNTVTPPAAPPRVVLKDLDTNGNGTSDLLFRSHSAARFVIWYMVGANRVAYNGTSLANSYELAGTGDFNGDRRTDLLWTSPARDILISFSTGAGYSNVQTPYTYSSGMQVLGASDINGNGKADIIFRNESAGQFYVWYMDGSTRVAYNAHPVGAGYEFVGSGDLNKDRMQDLVWTSSGRDVLISLSKGVSFTTSLAGLSYASNYELAGMTDVNGNGTADLILRSISAERSVIWFMDGMTRVAYSSKAMGARFRLVGKGDFNGDLRGDLVWTDGAGGIVMSVSTGVNFTDTVLPYTFAPDYLLMDAS